MTVKQLNRIAYSTLGAAKFLGMAGLGLGYFGHRMAGGISFALAFSFIVATIVLCMKALRIQKTQPTDGFETI